MSREEESTRTFVELADTLADDFGDFDDIVYARRLISRWREILDAADAAALMTSPGTHMGAPLVYGWCTATVPPGPHCSMWPGTRAPPRRSFRPAPDDGWPANAGKSPSGDHFPGEGGQRLPAAARVAAQGLAGVAGGSCRDRLSMWAGPSPPTAAGAPGPRGPRPGARRRV
ncbi:hypothetical protein AB0N81_40935 [Streptomyces sp. NPDC093510]|uniref:hypothetical protein n=1 Tax=Streptomyces sp. NPDC093510 TaxID=3155199 RepID=UPI0034266FE2